MLCNDVQREGAKLSLDLSPGLFYYVSLHKIRYGIQHMLFLPKDLQSRYSFWNFDYIEETSKKRFLKMASMDKTIVSGFVLTEPSLRRIYRNLSERTRQLTNDIDATFELKFANGLLVNRSSVDDVLAEENEGERAIRALKISLVGKTNATDIANVTLRFTDSSADPIYYSISSDNERWVQDSQRDLESEIGKIQKIAFSSYLSDTPRTVDYSPTGYFTSATILIIAKALGSSLKSSDYVFAWGKGLTAFNQRRAIVNLLLVAVILGFIVGVLAGITANYISSAWLHIGAKP